MNNLNKFKTISRTRLFKIYDKLTFDGINTYNDLIAYVFTRKGIYAEQIKHHEKIPNNTDSK